MEPIKEIKLDWDLTPLLSGDDDTNLEKRLKEIEEENYKFIKKWNERSDYLENAEILREALDEYELLERKYGSFGDPGYYFWARTQLESDNQHVKGKYNRIENLAIKIANDIEFFTIRVAKIPEKKQKELLDNNALESYRNFLKGLFDNAKYLLTEPEEKIMNLKGKSSYSNWTRMVSNFLSKEEAEIINEKGKKETKPYGELGALTYDPNKETRDSAAKALTNILEKHEELAEYELNSILYDKKVNDELRGLGRPDEASLVGDDIDPAIVDAMLDAVTSRYDIAQDFYKFKAELFNLEKLEYHERNLKYGKIDKRYTFEEGVNLVYETLSELDPEFGNYVKFYAENGRFDALPKKGKRSGGFCVKMLNTQPVYVFLNFTGNLFDVRTIAHEMGHAINDELIIRNQNSLNSSTSLATAEVASTFMEDFLVEKLSANVDEETKLALKISSLEDAIVSIPRQVACYRFEQNLHNFFRENNFLARDDIEKIFKNEMERYMGPAIKQSRLGEVSWVGWSHIRRYFYVYSYASGLLISKALQNKVRKDKGYVETVKHFLSTGSAKAPKDIFMEMEVDITKKDFWYAGLDEIANELNDVKTLAKNLGKI